MFITSSFNQYRTSKYIMSTNEILIIIGICIVVLGLSIFIVTREH
jgi:hypothetical protein